MDVDNQEVPQEQPQHNPVPITANAPDENEPEYKAPPIHVQIPSQVSQPTALYPYQYFQSGIPLAYPRAPFVVSPPFAYPGAPYALYGVQHGQTVNPCLMYLAQMFPQPAYPQAPAQTTP